MVVVVVVFSTLLSADWVMARMSGRLKNPLPLISKNCLLEPVEEEKPRQIWQTLVHVKNANDG